MAQYILKRRIHRCRLLNKKGIKQHLDTLYILLVLYMNVFSSILACVLVFISLIVPKKEHYLKKYRDEWLSFTHTETHLFHYFI